MKKKLLTLLSGTVALLLAVFSLPAKASHHIGSELNYLCIAPGIYVATLKIYRDCYGVAASPTATLNLKSLGCNNGRSLPMSQLGSRIGDPYCGQISPGCSSVGENNYQEVTYTATISFSAVEQNCPDWLLSWSECCWPEVANLQNAPGASQYAEAMVRLGSNINNSSPAFISNFMPYVNRDQPIMLSGYALEQDGDSVVFSLENPLTNNTTPILYKTFSAFTIYNADSTKSALVPAGALSKNFPIPSYHLDWTLPMPITPVQKFMFDPKTGSTGFIPVKYVRNSNHNNGLNKYVLVWQASEYRRVGGAVLKVGHVRRSILITVIDCGPNQNPNIVNPVANGQAITENTIISLRPGTPLNFQFASADGNAANILTLESNAATIMPGATFTKTTANQPTGTITWTPTASDVRSQVYYFQLTVTDNACPVKGFQTHTFGVKVSATGGVTGTSENNLGTSIFSAFPNPFSQELTFKLNLKTNAESLVIYNLLGQQVDKISLSNLAPGQQNIKWQNAGKFAAGTYVAKLISGGRSVETLKFTRLQ